MVRGSLTLNEGRDRPFWLVDWPPIGATMKLSQEDIGRIQRSEVRWMGVGVGIFLMLVGSAFAIGAFLAVGAVLRAGIDRSELPTLLFAAEMASVCR